MAGPVPATLERAGPAYAFGASIRKGRESRSLRPRPLWGTIRRGISTQRPESEPRGRAGRPPRNLARLANRACCLEPRGRAGNVGTIISFRLGLADAEIVENEFRPEISALIGLPNDHIYRKLMIQGGVSRVFGTGTLRVNSSQTEELGKKIKQAIACRKLP